MFLSASVWCHAHSQASKASTIFFQRKLRARLISFSSGLGLAEEGKKRSGDTSEVEDDEVDLWDGWAGAFRSWHLNWCAHRTLPFSQISSGQRLLRMPPETYVSSNLTRQLDSFHEASPSASVWCHAHSQASKASTIFFQRKLRARLISFSPHLPS